jgi:hypothetical protein
MSLDECKNWRKLKRQDGKEYYANAETKERRWDPPPCFVAAEADPANWEEKAAERKDGTSRMYYLCKPTKKKQWEKPPCLGGATPAQSAAQAQQKALDAKAEADVRAANEMKRAVNDPSKWEEKMDTNKGKKYYVNKTAKLRQWKRPACLGAGDETTGSQWGTRKSPTGRPYWYNKVTRVRLWDEPQELIDERIAAEAAAAKEEAKLKGEEDAKRALEEAANPKQEEASDDEQEEATPQEEEPVMKVNVVDLFEPPSSGLFGSRKTPDLDELLSFKKSGLTKALLKQNRSFHTQSVQAFKNILSYMGDRKSSKQEPIPHARKLLRNLMKTTQGLRDEVYLQVYKQTNNNPSQESCIKGWELMSFFLVSFPPSDILRSFFQDYFERNADGKTPNSDPVQHGSDKIRHMAKRSLLRLPKIINMGNRNQQPSTKELEWLQAQVEEEMKNARSADEGEMEAKDAKEAGYDPRLPPPEKKYNLTIHLINGDSKTIAVDSFTRIKEVTDQMCEQLRLKLTSPFALFQCERADDSKLNVDEKQLPENLINHTNRDMGLDPRQRVMDILGQWEHDPLEIIDKTKKKTFAKQKKELDDLKENVEYNALLFKARLMLNLRGGSRGELLPERHGEALMWIYRQAKHELVTQRYPPNDRDAGTIRDKLIKLAALQLCEAVAGVNNAATDVDVFPKLQCIYPGDHLPEKTADRKGLATEIGLIMSDRFSAYTALEARMRFIEIMALWSNYGASFFRVHQQMEISWGDTMLLGVNYQGVIFLEPPKKNKTAQRQELANFEDVVQWGSTDSKFVIVIGNTIQQKKVIMPTTHGRAISALINDYINLRIRQQQRMQ